MQYSEGRIGRVFAVRLEHGEPMPATLESFAAQQGVQSGLAIMVGGAEAGSKLVVGPEDGNTLPVTPMLAALSGAHEVAAVGTLFPDEQGQPVLHMHAACGRRGSEAAVPHTVTGCIREGIVTWQILEVILIEITDLEARRVEDRATGFQLLQCGAQRQT